VIALARSLAVADQALGERHARQLQHIWLPPIASRPEAVDRLLDRRFVERSSPLRMSRMTPDNQRALRAYRWPGNFASLREAADRLVLGARPARPSMTPPFGTLAGCN
jgi:DNA-binding NtrC family response regulator